MAKKKILIISYFFPPSAKAGAHRAYSMAEYLSRFGWEPVFIAPEKGYYGRIPRYDYKLLDKIKTYQVYRVPIIFPFKNHNLSLLARGSRKIWDLTFIPDGRVLWNFSIKKRISKIIRLHKPKIVFITGTPFSTFLLAPFLKKKFGLPVVLDYRDPWIGSIVEKNKNPFKFRICEKWEKEAMNHADLITTASYRIIDFIKMNSGEYVQGKRFFGLPYGFNQDRLNQIKIEKKKNNKIIVGTFAGFVHGDIDIHEILKGVKMAVDNNILIRQRLLIKCYGTLFGYTAAPDKLLKDYNLEKNIHIMGFEPYEKFLVTLKSSDFLILPHGKSSVTKVLYPTKLFDYLGVKKPILYWGEKGQVWETIIQCDAGLCYLPVADSISVSIQKIFNVHHNFYKTDEYLKFDRNKIFYDFVDQLNMLTTYS
jgi:hypothetical protein